MTDADTGDPAAFTTWEQFWQAYAEQTRYIIRKSVETYERSEEIRARFFQTPYLSCLVKGCAESGRDINQGGPELSFVTIEAVTYATTVDSLLAVKYLVFDKKLCAMAGTGARAARQLGRARETAGDRPATKRPSTGATTMRRTPWRRQVMELWTEETWKHKTKSTNRQFRPGMLSWNYWIAYSDILAASPDGRAKGKFLSNAMCPSNGADINGPTANANSVGKVMGGKSADGKGDWEEYFNVLPNGGSHTITFNPSILRDPEHQQKFKAFLRGYIENGGSALQINMLNADLLRDAQKHPENYRHLLVRVTGYNAYFTQSARNCRTRSSPAKATRCDKYHERSQPSPAPSCTCSASPPRTGRASAPPCSSRAARCAAPGATTRRASA